MVADTASVPNTLGLDMFMAVAEETMQFLRGSPDWFRLYGGTWHFGLW